MSLYAAGKTTGIVVDSGYDATNITPICDGFPITDAVVKMDVTGRTLNDYCQKLLNEAGNNFDSTAD